ncbi:MAG: tetratricopeptide repeat protein, partial [Burkholderiales bacterium]|nr:tetratricopeptide repeat protein [Opitutaceae bacterium]
EALIAAQRLPEAREPLEALVAREPANLEALLLLARVYDRMGRRDDGIALLEPVTKTHPDDPRVLGLCGGMSLLRAGELGVGFRALRLARRGRDLMERAVVLAPGDIAYREGLVDFYRQAPGMAGGDLEKARAHADAIARIDPVRGAVWRASILIDEEKYAEALAVCEAALAARPDDYVALFTLGKTVSESGLRLDDGERALRRCLAVVPAPSDPSHAGVWYRLGLISEHRGDLTAARAYHAEALKLEPFFNRPAEALERLDKAK